MSETTQAITKRNMKKQRGPVARTSGDEGSMKAAEDEAVDRFEHPEKYAKMPAEVLATLEQPKPVEEMIDGEVHQFNLFDAEFWNHGDRLGHSDDVIRRQSEFINMKTIQNGKGDVCMMSDTAAINYKGFTPNGKLVYDSRKSLAGGQTVFRVGYYEVSKCIDIAVQQMRPGQISAVYCPGVQDKGGNINQYPDSGDAWIPIYTDIRYEIEVVDCDTKIEIPRPSRPQNKLVDGKCFYLLSEQYTKDGAPLALDINIKSEYVAWGIFNAGIKKYMGPTSNNKSQQFMWNAQTKRVESYVIPGGFLKEGGNHNVIVYNNIQTAYDSGMRFIYDPKKKQLVSVLTDNVLDITNDKFVENQNVETNMRDGTKGQKWDVEYCM